MKSVDEETNKNDNDNDDEDYSDDDNDEVGGIPGDLLDINDIKTPKD